MLLLPNEVVKHSSETLFNREEGSLFITNKRLAWCRAGSETPVAEVLNENFITQQVSKAEAKKVMLRITAQPPGGVSSGQPNSVYTFTWKHTDNSVSIADRDKYMAELALILKRQQAAGSAGSAAGQGGASGASASNGHPSSGNGADSSAAAAGSSAGAGGSDYKKLVIGTPPASADEIKLRQDVLSKNAELAKLHKTLVVSGLIPEDEFWSTRKHILEAQAIQLQLRKGESSTWLDLAPTTQASGDFKYTITPNVARRIFREYPQVKRAYIDNVPHKVNEKQFWKRFVASQFFNRGRSADSAKGNRDPIFDKCSLEEDAVFGNTARHDLSFLSKLLDLTRSQEDSVETGNAPDFTMRPAVKDSKLSLLRRFNHHSELVLQSVLNSKRKHMSADHKTADAALKDATVLDDLETQEPEKRIKLNIQDRSRYFGSLSKGAGSGSSGKAHKSGELDPQSARDALHVSFDISRSLAGCGDTQKTMESLSRSVHAVALQQRPNRVQELCIPDELSAAVAECHGAGTEMLRHLWALIRLPLTGERQQRAEKIAAAFSSVQARIRETIIKANSVESKNAKLGSTVENMLQPIIESLQIGKQAFETRSKTALKSAS
ncbi:RNA polymerase II transcription factor B subunit 1 [Coemansia sp. Benny D115]|nr:RNA polymerase II transcription factor B subunit 1 [Coemansia sp. Benny D115]